MIQNYKNYAPQIHESCFIAPGSMVIGKVKIGKNSGVWFNAVIRGDMSGITIGENSNIQDCCVLHCINDIDIIIGDNVTVGHNAVLHSCTIGDGSLIGMGAIILDGARVGKNCLIGAGAVVTSHSEVPDGSLVLGSPGKVTRQLTDSQIAYMRTGSEEYMKLADEYRKNL